MILNKASRFGLYAVVMMASRDDRITAAEVARTYDISENHVAKVLQQLARARIVSSTRGVGGGYTLLRDPARLTMLEIVECLDGEFAKPCSGCALRIADGKCGGLPIACAIQKVLAELTEQSYYTLKSITIQTLARQGSGLTCIGEPASG